MNINSRITFAVSIICIFAAAAFSAGTYSGGDGLSPETAFHISSPDDFVLLRNNQDDWDKHFILTEDIDLLQATLLSQRFFIGSEAVPFTGSFNGDGKIIDGFHNFLVQDDFYGLFGYIGTAGVVKNLGLIDVMINAQSYSYVGALAGYCEGNIIGCLVSGQVQGGDCVGLLVGCNSGTLSDSSSNGSVDGLSTVGGLVGYSLGEITDSFSLAEVTSLGTCAGGLIGYNFADVTNCYATGDVSGIDYTGGLIGSSYANVTNSYATGSTSANDYVGGLIGSSFASVVQCYSTDKAIGLYCVGGLIGYSDGPVSNSYSTADASIREFNGGYVGGFIGCNDNNVTDCYSKGSAGGDYEVGGFIGYNTGSVTNAYSIGVPTGITSAGGFCGFNDAGDFTSCYFDTQASGSSTPVYVGSSDGVTGLAMIDMFKMSTYTGWDFESTETDPADWQINEGNTYPIMAYQVQVVVVGDLNNDTKVNLVDFAIFSTAWNTSLGDPDFNETCDLAGGDSISESDLIILAQNWLN